MDWLWQYWQSLTWNQILFGGGLFLGSIVFSILAVGVVMVSIPANYFSSHYQQDFLPNSTFLVRWGPVILKNLLGVFLIGVGFIMLIGPGQGLLTILLGLVMLDIPGKRPLEAKIIQRPSILSAINNLRARFSKPPLILD